MLENSKIHAWYVRWSMESMKMEVSMDREEAVLLHWSSTLIYHIVLHTMYQVSRRDILLH